MDINTDNKKELWRTKLKNNLKAIHNNRLKLSAVVLVVANQVKEQFESNSQHAWSETKGPERCGEPS